LTFFLQAVNSISFYLAALILREAERREDYQQNGVLIASSGLLSR